MVQASGNIISSMFEFDCRFFAKWARLRCRSKGAGKLGTFFLIL